MSLVMVLCWLFFFFFALSLIFSPQTCASLLQFLCWWYWFVGWQPTVLIRYSYIINVINYCIKWRKNAGWFQWFLIMQVFFFLKIVLIKLHSFSVLLFQCNFFYLFIIFQILSLFYYLCMDCTWGDCWASFIVSFNQWL